MSPTSFVRSISSLAVLVTMLFAPAKGAAAKGAPTEGTPAEGAPQEEQVTGLPLFGDKGEAPR